VLVGFAGAPPELGDRVPDLFGTIHVVVSNSPKMCGCCHGWFNLIRSDDGMNSAITLYLVRPPLLQRPASSESIWPARDRRWSSPPSRQDLVCSAKSHACHLPDPTRKGPKSLAASAVPLRGRNRRQFLHRPRPGQCALSRRRLPPRSAAARPASIPRGS